MPLREIHCQYQSYVPNAPVPSDQLYKQACANDNATIDAWRDIWIRNVTENKKKFGSFANHSMGSLYGQYLQRPAIIAGSGPSLKYNIDKLKDRHGLPLVSCLHNFHYMEDHGAAPEYYVSLDAGPVVLEEVSEGGDSSKDYWELTKDRTLIAYIGSDPMLFEKWKGKVYLFNCPIPNKEIQDEMNKVEPFNMWCSNGGNVLGSCLYIVKAVFRSPTTIFVGADFSFGYDKKFHSWGSKYDRKMGNVIPLTDVFGNRVASWPSYVNFKSYFEWVTLSVPGFYINCTEGGAFGSYPHGNIDSIRQMTFEDCMKLFAESEYIKDQCLDSTKESRYLLF